MHSNMKKKLNSHFKQQNVRLINRYEHRETFWAKQKSHREKCEREKENERNSQKY